MILIANREQELFVQLDERVRSRLQNCTRIQFDKYSIDELVSILRDRARWGLTENAVNTEGLRKIGDAAAGDARVAIGILRSAARTAEKENQETISEQLIEKSIPEAESEITRQTKDRLTPHQQVLYEIVLDAEKIDPGDLYSRYEQQVENAKTKRMIRNHLSKMRHYNLIAAEGATRGRTYRVVR